MLRLDRYQGARLGERADHRLGVTDLLLGRGRRAAATDVDDVGAGGKQRPALLDRVGTRCRAVGDHAEHAHEARPVECQPRPVPPRCDDGGERVGDPLADARPLLGRPAQQIGHRARSGRDAAIGLAREDLDFGEGERPAGERQCAALLDGGRRDGAFE